MLIATQLVSLAQVGFALRALAASLVVIVGASFGAGAVSRRVRKSPLLQVLLAAGLGVTGIPVELAGGGLLSDAVRTAVAWCAVFAASALVVRSLFVRRKVLSGAAPRYKLVMLEATALATCALSAAAFVAWGQGGHALALVLATLVLGVVGALQLAPKHVKPIGLALAGLMLACSGAFVFGEPLGQRLVPGDWRLACVACSPDAGRPLR
jgi:hypothetical protein